MIVDPDFLDHWRTGMVADAIGDPMAPIYILRLWAHCQRLRRASFSPRPKELARICKCECEPRRLMRALIDAGFISVWGREVTIQDVSWSVAPKGLDVSPRVWARLRAEVFARDRHTCTYCGDATGPHDCDHVVPRANGGKSEIENLVCACYRCNRSKGSKSLAEWGH